MSKAPNPLANQVVISRDRDHEGYYDVYTVQDGKELVVSNLHDINWPNTSNNEATDITSFKLGSNIANFKVFSDYDWDGEHASFDRDIRDLRDHEMPDGKHNWNNEIKSFKIHLK